MQYSATVKGGQKQPPPPSPPPQQTIQFQKKTDTNFPFEMLNEKLHRSFCGFEDFGISKRREQKPMCFVSSGFNCFGFQLSSKMVLPSACTCTWDVFCFASLRRLKKGPGFYQLDIILA